MEPLMRSASPWLAVGLILMLSGGVFAMAMPAAAAEFPRQTFRGGNAGWGVVIGANKAGTLRYNLVAPARVGVSFGALSVVAKPRIGQYALQGPLTSGDRQDELIVMIAPAAAGAPCRDSAGRTHPYAVIANGGRAGAWYGCGDFDAD
jgi:nitrate/nitrite transporter NarK